LGAKKPVVDLSLAGVVYEVDGCDALIPTGKLASTLAEEQKYIGLQLPPEVPMTTQERAYTSPIWYTP
jgi:hypothetical protein